MKRVTAWIIVAVVVVVCYWVALAQGWLPRFLGGPKAENSQSLSDGQQPPAQEGGPGRDVVALGRIEPAGEVIDIAATPGDRLARLAVEEGQSVEEGQPLAYLDSRALREIELQAANAQVQEAEARYAAEEKLAESRLITAQLGVEQAEARQLELTAQERNVEALRTGAELARKDRQRLSNLPQDLVSDQERERQALLVQKAEADLKVGEAQLERGRRVQKLAVDAAAADLAAARASRDQVLHAIPVESLKRARDLAQAQLERTILKAPCKGVVLKIYVRPYELLSTKPILQMANLDKMVVVAEVYETEVKRLRNDQPARVKSPALRHPYNRDGLTGKISRIGQTVLMPGLTSLDPLARSDRRVVEVRIDLDPASSRQAADFTNLQVEVTFLSEPR